MLSGGFGTVRLAILKAPEKESGNISEELDDILPEKARLKNMKGRKISKSFTLMPGLNRSSNNSCNSDVVMKSEQARVEESKFAKGNSSPYEDS